MKEPVYERLKSYDGPANEHAIFVDTIISEANIPENASDKEKIICIADCIAKFKYDNDQFKSLVLENHIPGWKVMRDCNITICDSDGKLFKSCMDKLGVKCRVITSDNHLWNQVYIDDKWVAIDVTLYRSKNQNKNYLFFNDEYRNILRIYEESW